MVEAAGAHVHLESHLLECFTVPLALPIIMIFDGLPRTLDSRALEELDGVELRGMADASHSKSGEVGQSLDVFLACNDPADADPGALEAFGAGTDDKDIASVKVLDILKSTYRW